MVARIKVPSAIIRALNYNEQKVKQGHAILLYAANFLKDANELNFKEKISRFQNLLMLNDRAKTNSLHISLNFHNSDELTSEKYVEIADSYMSKIGFADQPYLVYQHNDAGHPHIHIITTNIKVDGSRISLHNIGRNQSENARKEIEREFNLTKADDKQLLQQELKPVNAQRIQYGKAETKRAISNVLNHVLPTYKYGSLAELNAILQQYNVIADRGKENSQIFKKDGLVYRILDSKGQKTGVPIKASLISSQPTLKNIAINYDRNDRDKQLHKQRVMSAIDFILLKKSNITLKDLISALQKEKIHVVLRQNISGFVYGITYVDHQSKCVFNGSYLGKQYSANALQQRCDADKQLQAEKPKVVQPSFKIDEWETQRPTLGFEKLFDTLLQPEEDKLAGEPAEQRKFKKRKKKQKHSHN